ncbi:MAG: PQQ-binding-like beta-propeller repeat protein, partial [Pirellulaceae bacterium]
MRSPRPAFRASLCLSLCAAGLMIHSALRAEWPQFRGPRGDGVAEVKDAPLRWSTTENIAWRTEVLGTGWSSPILVGDKIWMTTSEVEGKGPVVLKAVEVDLASGELGKIVELFQIVEPVALHTTNSNASPTPVTDGSRLYCHFGTYGTCCVDTATAKVVWRNQEHQLDHDTGPGSSPVLVGEHLIFPCDGLDVQYVAALDKETGETVWRTDRPQHRNRRKAHSTPLVTQVNGKTQVIIVGAQWVCGYDPATGEELWRFDFGDGYSNVPCPVYQDGVIYISTGFDKADLVAVRIDGTGDLTETGEVWRMNRQVPTTPSPVLAAGRLYMVSDRGVATCVDLKTGDSIWVERLGGNFSASPTLAEGRIYFFGEDGRTTVIEPGDQYKVLAENDLKEKIKASPIFLDG